MTAHWVVFAAAVLATLVAATMAAALTVFTGQALPLAVRHDLAADHITGGPWLAPRVLRHGNPFPGGC